MLQKELNAVLTAMWLACMVERCIALPVDSVNVSTMLQQQPDASFVTSPTCIMERGVAIPVHHLHVSTMLQKQPNIGFTATNLASAMERCIASIVDSVNPDAILQK